MYKGKILKGRQASVFYTCCIASVAVWQMTFRNPDLVRLQFFEAMHNVGNCRGLESWQYEEFGRTESAGSMITYSNQLFS